MGLEKSTQTWCCCCAPVRPIRAGYLATTTNNNYWKFSPEGWKNHPWMEKSSREITLARRFCLTSEKSQYVSNNLVSDPISWSEPSPFFSREIKLLACCNTLWRIKINGIKDLADNIFNHHSSFHKFWVHKCQQTSCQVKVKISKVLWQSIAWHLWNQILH